MERRGCCALGSLCLVFLGIATYQVMRGSLEEVFGPTPQSKVADYVRALARADEQAAFAVWELPPEPTASNTQYAQSVRQRNLALDERRQSATQELITTGTRADFTIASIQWWNGCCSPAVMDDPKGAGGARATVLLRSADGGELRYIFDVWHREGAYYGWLTGEPHHWALFDVYPEDQQPLYWRYERRPSGVVQLPDGRAVP